MAERENQTIKLIIMIVVAENLRTWINQFFYPMISSESKMICERISSNVNVLYLSASKQWHAKNTNTAQSESIRESFYAYGSMSSSLTYAFQTALDTIAIIFICIFEDISILFVTFAGTYILYKINKTYNATAEAFDKKIIDLTSEFQLEISNSFTNRSDLIHNPHFVNLIGKDAANPIISISKTNSLWDERKYLSIKVEAITTTIKSMIVLIYAFYLWRKSMIALLIYIFINHGRLFGFINVISQLETTKNISAGRLSNTFTLIESSLAKDKISLTIGTVPREAKVINVSNISQTINEDIRLEFKGMVDIDLGAAGIILLNGKKGCGKSVTMDILAGQYDGKVTSYMMIDGVEAVNEFRELQDRIYIRQCIVDDYVANRKKTITMTLTELFPNASKSQIMDFLGSFGLMHKIKNLDMDSALSKDERGLSPGERQSFVLASQLWKAISLNSRLLLLDEPERNIDFESIKNIFDSILLNEKYNFKIILITHLNELKEYLYRKHAIRQTWRYAENSSGVLSFTVEKN
ncbi:MAG: putative ATP-dependent transporter [Hyperionvirus sp.]|uniref:Putative ATP-dependent transporter n=1 Tax=Hyperionvirus sp. TaxID=2487770 RepID=A0A3G5AA93_9VIRU|nr:MAG: putative ATP-dependent transporter [Hyperionvirus sp.]